MKLGDKFKQWDVFKNSNGHLTIVYAFGSKVKVINYNGSDYTTADTFNEKYQYLGNGGILAKTFFKDYPTHKIDPQRKEEMVVKLQLLLLL